MNFEELIAITDKPVIAADINGIIFMVNTVFSKEFGWQPEELVGKHLTNIIPAALRDAHLLGFSAYISTGKASLLGQHLDLEVENSDGSLSLADHYILNGEIDGKVCFAAIISPRK